MTEDEIDEIFAAPLDLPPRQQGVIRSEAVRPPQPWEHLWDEWSRLTERPASPIPSAFVRVVRRKMKEGKSTEELMDRVRAATYLTPPADDSSDTHRVVKCLSNVRIYRQACRERALDGSERKTFAEYDETEVRSTLEEVVETTGIPRRRLTRSELSAAMSLQMYTREELAEFAFRARQRLGSVIAYPSEMLREAESQMNPEMAPDAEIAVSGGAPEDVLLSVDTLATRLHLRGASPSKIREVHNQAPPGYWENVVRLRDRTRMPLAQVYDDLASAYDWHPSTREAMR